LVLFFFSPLLYFSHNMLSRLASRLPVASSPSSRGLGAVLTAYTAPPPADVRVEGDSEKEPPPSGGTDLPSAPRELKAVIVSTRFVTLSWNPPEKVNAPIVTYSVFYRQEGSER
jgi:hypothetical protein